MSDEHDSAARIGGQAGATSDSRLLTEALAEFCAAVEGGVKVDRDALLARYPQVAEELARCLETYDFVQHAALHIAGQDGSMPAPAPAMAPSAAATLGDFRLVREIGRGGMGVVYEAEQVSLQRRVALKVLPFAAVLDRRQLQRFNTEAMAAARLHHQHIVPVYQVRS